MGSERELPPIGRPTVARPGRQRVPVSRAPAAWKVLGIGGFFLVLVVSVLAMSTSSTPAGADAPTRAVSAAVVGRPGEARVACENAILGQLVAPGSARFSRYYTPEPVWNPLLSQWQWTVNVEAQNAFGVRLASRWSCEWRRGEGARVEQVR